MRLISSYDTSSQIFKPGEPYTGTPQSSSPPACYRAAPEPDRASRRVSAPRAFSVGARDRTFLDSRSDHHDCFCRNRTSARGVNTSGMLAGGVIAFIIAGRELKAFWVLLVVFLLTLVATRAGRSRKQQLRVAEPGSGRSASQVAANLGVAALCLALPAFNGFILLALSALAEAAADTVSSESGSAFPGKTVLITTWQPVTPGTDGGVSLTGTLSGAVAALIVAGASYAFGLIPP